MGIVISGASGPSIEAIQAIVDDSLASVSGLPDGGTNGDTVVKDDGQPKGAKWASQETLVVSRAWESPQLLYAQDFTAGLPGSPWSFSNYSVVAMSAITSKASGTGYGTEPSYSWVIQGVNAVTKLATLDLNAVTALTGKTPLLIKFWENVFRPTSTVISSTFTDGATLRQTTTPATTGPLWSGWAQRSFPIGSVNNDQKWASTSSGSAVHVVTGIEVYGTPDPYMLGVVVAYGGHFYKSTQDNNPYTPGSGQGWVQV